MRTVGTLLLCALFLGAGSVVSAQDSKSGSPDPGTVTLSGYIVDAMCGSAIAKKSDPMKKASRHTRACALAEACAAEGYGIFAEGKWVLFDEAGNALANAALKKDERQQQLYFRVRGKRQADRFAVIAIEPVPAPQTTDTSGSPSTR
jgi:hypothetical protein